VPARPKRSTTSAWSTTGRAGTGRAAEHHQQALDLFRALGYQVGEAAALNNLGVAYAGQGRYEQAAEHHRRALGLFRATGHRDGEADALTSLGLVDRRQGRYELAAEHHRQALAPPPGDRRPRPGNGGAEHLGEVLQATGHPDQARVQHAAALDRTGERRSVTCSRQQSGGACHPTAASGYGTGSRHQRGTTSPDHHSPIFSPSRAARQRP